MDSIGCLVGENFKIRKAFLFAESTFSIIFFADEWTVFDWANSIAENIIKTEGCENDKVIVFVKADAEASNGFGH